MKRVVALLLALLGSATSGLGRGAQQALPAADFFPVDVYVDTGGESLAAWQVEIVDRAGVARIVGVEGGEHPAFAAAPYYDPRALQQGRIVLAAFQTQGELPAGRVRVARVHLHVEGPAAPDLAIRPMASADAQGRSFPVRAELVR